MILLTLPDGSSLPNCPRQHLSLGEPSGLRLDERTGRAASFNNWSGATLTDSGGFQMVSLLDLAEISVSNTLLLANNVLLTKSNKNFPSLYILFYGITWDPRKRKMG